MKVSPPRLPPSVTVRVRRKEEQEGAGLARSLRLTRRGAGGRAPRRAWRPLRSGCAPLGDAAAQPLTHEFGCPGPGLQARAQLPAESSPGLARRPHRMAALGPDARTQPHAAPHGPPPNAVAWAGAPAHGWKGPSSAHGSGQRAPCAAAHSGRRLPAGPPASDSGSGPVPHRRLFTDLLREETVTSSATGRRTHAPVPKLI